MKSPLAPSRIEVPLPVEGVRYASVSAGVKYPDRLDVMLMHFAPGSVMAGVFTSSATRSAPVMHSQLILGREGAKGIAILANSGNANAFTGRAGEEACAASISAAAKRLGIENDAVHMASTGVIGEVLPHERVVDAIGELVAGLDEAGGGEAAQAIMTTDTFSKTASRSFVLDGTPITISGFAKGSGMIAPDMATMLGFIATDAKIAQPVLQEMLRKSVAGSFNAISVDSDMSTSDSVYLGASWRADMEAITGVNDPRLPGFQAELDAITLDLAHQIVRDGEGASKFVEIRVSGAASEKSARKIGMAIANSPLVKTAIAGEDPNWGRIVMAVGKAGEPADRDLLRISFGDVLIAENGAAHPGFCEAEAARHMKGSDIHIHVDIGLGDGEFTVWSCDLTKRYIEINADYRS